MPYYKRGNTGRWYGAEQPLCGVYCMGAVNERDSSLAACFGQCRVSEGPHHTSASTTLPRLAAF